MKKVKEYVFEAGCLARGVTIKWPGVVLAGILVIIVAITGCSPQSGVVSHKDSKYEAGTSLDLKHKLKNTSIEDDNSHVDDFTRRFIEVYPRGMMPVEIYKLNKMSSMFRHSSSGRSVHVISASSSHE